MGGRVLVVDDDPLLGVAIRRLLRDHEVQLAATGRAALLLLATGPVYRLVIVDVNLPDMDGCALLEEMARVAPGQEDNAVLITGHASQELRRRYGGRILEKPFAPEGLRALAVESGLV